MNNIYIKRLVTFSLEPIWRVGDFEPQTFIHVYQPWNKNQGSWIWGLLRKVAYSYVLLLEMTPQFSSVRSLCFVRRP